MTASTRSQEHIMQQIMSIQHVIGNSINETKGMNWDLSIQRVLVQKTKHRKLDPEAIQYPPYHLIIAQPKQKEKFSEPPIE